MSILFKFVLFLLAFKPNAINAKLYKQMPFPASNNTLSIVQEKSGIENKIHCASLCAMQSVTCQSYLFDLSNETCKMLNFANNSQGNFTTTKDGLGYVDLGKPI